MNCLWCGSSNLQSARMRTSDIPRLLLMQQPVRCRFCNERYFASMLSVWKLNATAKARRNERRQRQSNPA
jgi:hypothetical protein